MKEGGSATRIARFPNMCTSGILFVYLVLLSPMMNAINEELSIDGNHCQRKKFTAPVDLFS